MATQYTAGITQGQNWTAAIANQIGAVWETWTPAVYQPGLITSTTTEARYGRIQKLVFGTFNITITGAGTAGQSLFISLPVTTKSTSVVVGAGFLYDASAALLYNGSFNTPTTGGFWLIGDWANNGVWGTVPNLAVANGDIYRGMFMYEAA